VPNDPVVAPRRGPVEYLLNCIETGEAIAGPLDPAISRIGQRIVDTAFASAREKRTLPLIG
jgi:glucose-fructose oxidoreductase